MADCLELFWLFFSSYIWYAECKSYSWRVAKARLRTCAFAAAVHTTFVPGKSAAAESPNCRITAGQAVTSSSAITAIFKNIAIRP